MVIISGTWVYLLNFHQGWLQDGQAVNQSFLEADSHIPLHHLWVHYSHGFMTALSDFSSLPSSFHAGFILLSILQAALAQAPYHIPLPPTSWPHLWYGYQHFVCTLVHHVSFALLIHDHGLSDSVIMAFKTIKWHLLKSQQLYILLRLIVCDNWVPSSGV